MREIVLDTETTGLDPAKGDRLVEIGCVELLNTIPTGKEYHVYINPERDMPEAAFNVHGLSQAFLSDKPKFADVATEFLEFIENAPLIIHNAEFDIRFLNAELARVQKPDLEMHRVIDTLMLARRKHPGQSNGLDALCQRYNIDNTKRTKHGALIDSYLLAEVYAELTGGRQTAMSLDQNAARRGSVKAPTKQRPEPFKWGASADEQSAHAGFIAEMGEKAIWTLYVDQDKALG
ncbi:MAG: DNA polymerase III subunit epsilon [Hyphomicrobiales bacterium]|nr:DNA polymerase III subunit epsilon [Hyphomicrobiales bacterium]MDE2114129.1 DNA polymerase III subunit epsilon [Hyphomicrobiales bacterium]